MNLNLVTYALLGLAYSASDSDFDKLKVGLKDLYTANTTLIPLAARLVFHDLLLQSKVAGSGCIESNTFLNHAIHTGLKPMVLELQNMLQKQEFPNGTFTRGDVIAFAGKIAVEMAYPCIHIPFMYHRGACTATTPMGGGSIPPTPFTNNVAGYDAHVKYLQMTTTEFAILTIGGHAIKDAAAHQANTGWNGVFSSFSSGKAFIAQTLNSTWTTTMAGTNGAYISTSNPFIRFPSDMVFFPDSIPSRGRLRNDTTPQAAPFKDENAKPIQEALRDFTTKPRISFDQAFGDVFAKLLARAGGTTIYREKEELGFCPEFPGQQPPPNFGASSSKSEPNSNSVLKLSNIFVVLYVFLV